MTLDSFYESYRQFYRERGPFVPGFGNSNARVVLVGEAPGKDEVRLGRPFVGKAGANLDAFLAKIALPREELYVTNTFKFQLGKPGARPGSIVNRPATTAEVVGAMAWIAEELALLRPSWVVTLGNVPLRAVTGNIRAVVGDVHGTVLQSDHLPEGCRLFPLYHPASLIYNPGLQETYENDIFKLKAEISEG